MAADPDVEAPVRAPLPEVGARLSRFDARGLPLVALTVLAALFTLRLAAGFVVPVVTAVLFAYALNPVVTWLERWRVPRALGAVLVLGVILAVIVAGLWSMRGQAQAIVDQAPIVARRVARVIDAYNNSRSELASVQQAMRSLQQAGEHATHTPGTPVPPVVVAEQAQPLRSLIMAGGTEALTFVGQTVMIIFLLFFLLSAGDKFKRKFVKIAGTTLSEKKVTVQMFDQIDRTVQRYLAMLVVTNILFGLACLVTFRLFGLANAGAWALAGGVLHLIPYFGPLVIAGLTGMAAFLQFSSVPIACAVAFACLVWAALIGMVLATWLTGRIARMNAVSVFLALLLFGFLWGVSGALLAAPLAVILKVACDHIEGLMPVAEFMGE